MNMESAEQQQKNIDDHETDFSQLTKIVLRKTTFREQTELFWIKSVFIFQNLYKDLIGNHKQSSKVFSSPSRVVFHCIRGEKTP